jgi:hypothetical protein
MFVRLLILPITWAFLLIAAVSMILIGGIRWVITGKSYVVRLTIGD